MVVVVLRPPLRVRLLSVRVGVTALELDTNELAIVAVVIVGVEPIDRSDWARPCDPRAEEPWVARVGRGVTAGVPELGDRARVVPLVLCLEEARRCVLDVHLREIEG